MSTSYELMMKDKVKFKGLTFRFDKETSLNIVTTGSPQRTLKYSYDGKNWETLLDTQNNISNTITVPANTNIYLKGNCVSTQTTSNFVTFNTNTSNSNLYVFGNIYSILDENNFETITDLSTYNSSFAYYKIFNYSFNEIYADKLLLPATILKANCYRMLFAFSNIVTAKFDLPSNDMVDGCYYSLFEKCPKLKYPPQLNAMNLADNCYRSMFFGDINLEYAPDLLAQTLKPNCYRYMFNSTEKIKSIKVGFTTNFNSNYTQYWCSAESGYVFYPNGILYYNGSDRTYASYGIPNGWTVESF